MNRKIANILKSKIEVLSFVDKIAGLVHAARIDIKDGDGRKEKVFPISCDIDYESCMQGAYNDLTPDSRHKSIIYFEDGGVRYVRHEHQRICYESTLSLVVWLNLKKLNGAECGDGCATSACAVTNIIQAIDSVPYNEDPFVSIYSVVTSQDVRDVGIFSKYTYNEKRTQFLMYPYDFFALNIQTAFALPLGCITPCFDD